MKNDSLEIYEIFLLVRMSFLFSINRFKEYIIFLMLSSFFYSIPHFFPSKNRHLYGGLDVLYDAHTFLFLTFFILGFYFQSILILKIWYVISGKSESFISICNKALKKLPLALIVTFLSTLAVLAGFVFFIIPGIILIVYFAFSYPLSFIENKGPIGIIKTSYNLVENNWFFVFLSLLFTVFLSVFASVIIEKSLLDILVVKLPQGEIHILQGVVRFVVSLISSSFIIPYYLLMLRALMHKSLKQVYSEILC